MNLSIADKIQLKLIYISCRKMGLQYISGHLIAPDYIDKNAIIIDLGGNLGNFSREMEQRFKCSCYCVEPDPALFERIPESDRIKKYNIAVADKDGEMEFTLSDNNESNSFNSTIANIWGKNKVINVQTRSLESLKKEMGIDGVDLLKVDIEGSEIPLLKSLTDKELLKIPQLTVEFHEFLDSSLEAATMDSIKRLQKMGFLMIVYSARKFSDVLFLNTRVIKLNWWQQCWFWVHKLVRHRVTSLKA